MKLQTTPQEGEGMEETAQEVLILWRNFSGNPAIFYDLIIFSLIWTFGGVIDETSRGKFELFVLNIVDGKTELLAEI
jgi:hypothetical protein